MCLDPSWVLKWYLPGAGARSTVAVMLQLLFMLATGAAAGADHQVRVGDGTVDGSRIVPYVTLWNVTLTTPDGRSADGGTWRDRVRIVDYNGRKALLREQIQDAPPPRTSEIISVWVDPVTLRPIASQTQTAPGALYRNEFDGDRMTVREIEPEKGFEPSVKTRVLDTAAYDFYGGLFGTLLAAMPLDVGDSYTFPVCGEAEAGPAIVMTTARVVGREPIEAGYLGRVPVKVVELDAQNGAHYTFWIAETAPYILKLQLKGPRGGLITWTLPDRAR
jgi:hypothetical protein